MKRISEMGGMILGESFLASLSLNPYTVVTKKSIRR